MSLDLMGFLHMQLGFVLRFMTLPELILLLKPLYAVLGDDWANYLVYFLICFGYMHCYFLCLSLL
jgi:hypothetical protein